MIKQRYRRAATILLISLALASCRGSESATPTKSPSPKELSRLEPSHLTVAVEGDLSFKYSGNVDLRIVSLTKSARSHVNFLSVGIHDMKPLDSGAMFRIAFDLAGVFEGQGDYMLPAKDPNAAAVPSIDPKNVDPNAGAEVFSGVFLSYLKLKPGATESRPETAEAVHQFEKVLVPCKVEVGKDEMTGKLVCPKIGDIASDKSVRVEMEWGKPQ